MRQKLEDGIIYVKVDEKLEKEREAAIKTWRLMKKDRKRGYWYGPAGRELLEKIRQEGGLIRPARELLEELTAIQKAVDAERVKPDADIKPACEFPVKAKLYTHQVRAANMALMTFGAVPVEGAHGL